MTTGLKAFAAKISWPPILVRSRRPVVVLTRTSLTDLLHAAGEPGHSSRLELGGENDLFAPFETQVAQLFFRLRGETPPLMEDPGQKIAAAEVRLVVLELAGDEAPDPERMRVIDEDRNLSLFSGFFARGEGEKGLGLDPGTDLQAVVEQADRSLFSRPDGGAGEDVMKLGKGQVPERFGEVAVGVFHQTLKGGDRSHFFRGEEFVLEPPMALFHADHGRIASDGPGIETMGDAGQGVPPSSELLEIRLGGGVEDFELPGRGYQLVQVVEILLRRAAAVIAYPPEQEAHLAVGAGSHPVFDLSPRLPPLRVVMGLGPSGQDLGAVIANPDEFIVRQGQKVRVRAAEEVGLIAALGQDLDESSGVSKRVEVGGGLDVDPEFFPEISFSEKDLPDQGLSAGHVAVRLEEPPSQDVPATRLDQPLDPFKEGGLVVLDPLVKEGFVVTEDEILPPLAEIGGRPEGGQGFARAFRPFPKPDGVQMGVADEMDTFHSFSLTNSVIRV
jgi:hypothetical protein